MCSTLGPGVILSLRDVSDLGWLVLYIFVLIIVPSSSKPSLLLMRLDIDALIIRIRHLLGHMGHHCGHRHMAFFRRYHSSGEPFRYDP